MKDRTNELVQILDEHQTLMGFDVETDSDNHAVCFSIAWGSTIKETACFFVDELTFPIKQLDNFQTIMHYGKKADIPPMMALRQHMRVTVDTYVAARLFFWERGTWDAGSSLKALAVDLLHVESWGNAVEFIKRYGSITNVPRPLLSLYNRYDALYQRRLWVEYFEDKFTGKKLELLLVESALMHVLADIKHVGMLFDKTRIEEIKNSIKEELVDIDNQIQVLSQAFLSDLLWE